MASEIKQLSSGKQESERKRKQLEQHLQELNIRIAETDRAKGDAGEKALKLQVEQKDLNERADDCTLL